MASSKTPIPIEGTSTLAITDEKKEITFSTTEKRTIDTASKYAEEKQKNMDELCDKVDKMGAFRLFWDSKVPQNKSGWVSFSSSDPKDMKKHMEEYQKFYAEMKSVMQNIKNNEIGGIENIEEVIDDLYEKLEDLAEASETGETCTNSKQLAKVYKAFMEEHEKLENKIRRVESAGLRQKQKVINKKCEDAMEKITTLSEELKSEKSRMEAYIAELKEENRVSRNERQDILNENKKILNLLEKLSDKFQP